MRSVGAIVALALVVLLVGCNEDPVTAPTTQEFAAKRDKLKEALMKGRKTQQHASVPESEPESQLQTGFGTVSEGYVYDESGKRDPFRSLQFVDEEAPKVGFGPLGDYELGQLAVVAVVWDTGRPRALVTDPGGRSFMVGEGSQIGKNSGRVIHIGDNLVLVKETFVDFDGNQSTKDVEMRIRRSQGG